MVFYLKYRPQTLDDLVGQERVKADLIKAFEGNHLSHAYLFCGPRGTGKTSTARILAKMVNCLGAVVPCNKCASCISITDGSSLDLIEIDAASNRGIDDIRDLKEKIKLAPSSSKKKVYIIDEVHMLSAEAFNALLKTLEEPPAHVLFILATTELHKIPETILSRVTKLDFKTASTSDLVKALKKVAEGEKLEVEEQALIALAKKSDGSFRDAIKILDQVSSISSKITLSLVEESLRSSNFENQTKLLQTILDSNSAQALKIVSEQVNLGVNIKEYILSIMDLLRSILFIKYQLGEALKDSFSEEKYQVLEKLAGEFSKDQLLKAISSFQEALEKLKVTSIPSLPLEIAVVESSELNVKSEKIKEDLQIYKEEALVKPEPVIFEAKPNDDVMVVAVDLSPDSTSMSILKDKWNYILETVKPHNYSLEAMLKLVKILECSDDKLVLEVPYAFHQRILEAPKSRNLLESVLSEVLGRAIKVFTVLGKRPIEREELANVEVAADDEIIRVAAEIFNSETVN